MFTLLAALEAEDSEAAAEVSRLSAPDSCSAARCAPSPLGAVVALAEVFVGGLPVFAGLTALVLALVAAGCLLKSATFRTWAVIRTYELSWWNDDMDAKLADEQQRRRLLTR